MTTITIYSKAHRAAALAGAGPGDAEAYDAFFPDFLARLSEAAAKEGFSVLVDPGESGGQVYSVSEFALLDWRVAHDFMMNSRAADFWESYQAHGAA